MFAPVEPIERALLSLAETFGEVSVATTVVPAIGAFDSAGPPPLVGEEHALGDRFHEPHRRAQFIAGRVAARRALGQCLGPTVAADLVIGRSPAGAPVVDGHGYLHVSIAHSASVAVAVVARFPLGVDIERNDPRPEAFARLFFTDTERRKISAVDAGERPAVINTLWTRKEAACKVGHWGGRLPFARLDCADDAVTVDGQGLDVRSTSAANYQLSLATFRRRSAHG